MIDLRYLSKDEARYVVDRTSTADAIIVVSSYLHKIDWIHIDKLKREESW